MKYVTCEEKECQPGVNLSMSKAVCIIGAELGTKHTVFAGANLFFLFNIDLYSR